MLDITCLLSVSATSRVYLCPQWLPQCNRELGPFLFFFLRDGGACTDILYKLKTRIQEKGWEGSSV